MEKMKKNEIMVNDINELGFGGSSNQKILNTVEDGKTLFNLDSSVDYKLNDCVGETINVVDYVIKVFEKDLKEPIVDEATGEIIQDKEYKRVTILIDDKGKSYVTASKMFNIQFLKAIAFFGNEKIKKEGLVITIKNVSVKNSSNKALGFELV